jgi:hypothetical protein
VHQPADVLVPHNDFNSNAVLLRRDAALAAGGFRTDLARAADLDMWVRLLERGSAVKIPRVTAVYHLHESQVSPPDPAAMRRAHRAVLDSYAGRPWHTQTLVARHEGAVAWDEAREALAQGRPRRRVLMRLLRVLASPARARGVLELLLARRRRRALAVRLAAAAPPGALRGSGRLRERISYRIRHHTRLALLGAFGRPVRCSECGGELFRAIVFVRHGRVWIYGAAESTVRVAFADREALQFRHMELDRCPTSARPWLERPEVPPVSPRP